MVDSVDRGDGRANAEGRIVMYGLDWARFEQLIEIRGIDGQHPRFAYLDGAVELMSPSDDHESLSSRFNVLVSNYLEELDVDFEPVGSWTLKRKRKKAGAEPDECFILGRSLKSQPRRPDLVVEVVWTRGGLDKLEIYRRIGVPEVWFWIQGTITVHRLVDDAYTKAETSTLVPGLDVKLLARLVTLPTKEGIRALRAAVASQRG